MKKELFKELNAHIRACDNKALAVNTAYLGLIIFINSLRTTDRLLFDAISNFGIDKSYYPLVLNLCLLFSGYFVLFLQIWYRSWKVYYLNICHKIYLEEKEEFGEFVPNWMKQETSLMSWDNVFRLTPFIVGLVVITNIAGLINELTGGFIWAWALFIIAHFAISWALLKGVSNLNSFSA